MKLSSDSPTILWVIRWAAMMTSRFMVGIDGKTGNERRRGRKCKTEVVPFGGSIWYKTRREGESRKDKLDTE